MIWVSGAFAATWIASSVIAYGLCVAYFFRKYGGSLAHRRRYAMATCWVGPLSLVAWLGFAATNDSGDGFKYGWML